VESSVVAYWLVFAHASRHEQAQANWQALISAKQEYLVKKPSKKAVDNSHIYKICDKAELTTYHARKMDLWDACKDEVQSLMDGAWRTVDQRDPHAIAYIKGMAQKLGIVLEERGK
jgi:hypothetical protein